MSFSALISDAISAIFSSIRDAADVNTDDARAGAALSRSALGWLPAACCIYLVATIDASNFLSKTHLTTAFLDMARL